MLFLIVVLCNYVSNKNYKRKIEAFRNEISTMDLYSEFEDCPNCGCGTFSIEGRDRVDNYIVITQECAICRSVFHRKIKVAEKTS